MQAQPPLIHITESSHDVAIDLIYAGKNNFTDQVIYTHALCFLHPQAEACLRQAVAAARGMGLRIKILDAFRPQEAQEALWAVAPNPDYVADPALGSNHTRGVAVDLTLVGADGQALDMGTPVDTMHPASHHFHAAHPVAVQLNRMRLLTVMLEAGFVHHPREWWHYELPDAQRFPLIDSHAFMACVPAVEHHAFHRISDSPWTARALAGQAPPYDAGHGADQVPRLSLKGAMLIAAGDSFFTPPIKHHESLHFKTGRHLGCDPDHPAGLGGGGGFQPRGRGGVCLCRRHGRPDL